MQEKIQKNVITNLTLMNSADFGSQMSQYASFFSIGKRTGLVPCFIKETLHGRVFLYALSEPFDHVPAVYSMDELKDNRFYSFDIVVPQDKITDERVFSLVNDKNYQINGDLSLFKYFDDIKPDILNLYTFKKEIKNFCLNYLNNVKTSQDEVLVSIHFRRGDYLTCSSLNLSLNYYYEAVNTIQNLLPNKNIKYLIFSNGMDWVKENFKLNNCVYVEGLTRYQDMCLMSMCDHNIIVNSSFSWWGAYLNNKENKIVICPHKYGGDGGDGRILNGNYFPKEWISLTTQ